MDIRSDPPLASRSTGKRSVEPLSASSKIYAARARRSASWQVTRARSERASARAVDDAAFREVVRRQFDGDGVAFQDADVVLAHLAGDVRRHDVAVLELDAKGSVR